MDRRDVYEEEMKDIRGHNQPYLNTAYDPHAISTDNLMMPERLAATPSPRGRMRPGYPGAHDSVGSGHGWHPDSIPGTPMDSRCTTPTLSPVRAPAFNNDDILQQV